MKKLLLVFSFAFAGSLLAVLLPGFLSGRAADGGPATDQRFCTDPNGDGEVDVSDAVYILKYLFSGDGPPWCIAQGVPLDDVESRLVDLTARLEALESSTTSRLDALEASAGEGALIATGEYTGDGADLHWIPTGLGAPIKFLRIWFDNEPFGVPYYSGDVTKTDFMPGAAGGSPDAQFLALEGDSFIVRESRISQLNIAGRRYVWVAFAKAP